MDNNELDLILREKLKGKINPSTEMQNEIKRKVEEEKKLQKSMQRPNRNKKYTKIQSIISIAAVVLIVFVVGMNLNGNIIDNREVNTAIITAVEPTKLESGILANDSEFIIRTEGENINKESVQKSLYIEPALEYTIEKTSNSNEYKLKFKQNIPDNTIVRLQYVKDKITEDSWAYQTSNDLSITRTYPDDNSSAVLPTSSIEIEFSYASVENLEKNVQITPEVEGKWEHLGKVWRFTPSQKLKEQNYTVKINKGITAEKEKLENSYTFEFTVSKNENIECEYISQTIDGIVTYKSNEAIKLYYTQYTGEDEKLEFSTVEISKFKSVDDFIEYLESRNSKKAESLGKYEFSQKEEFVQLNKTLQDGYYTASVKTSSGKEAFNCPIQINSINAYALETERDVIVWTVNENGLAKNINVEYLGKEQKTNDQGIAKFEGITDSSKTIKYLKVGNDENKLVVGIYNYDFENYPSGYIYTDRPLYKNTDTIKIWGFVPRQFFYDKIEDEFYIELGNEGKQKVEVNDEGILNYTIDLNNHNDIDYSNVSLYYKDTFIASKPIEIKNYELQNYNYETIASKNYVYNGNNYEFDVKVTHITGLVVPNKSVVVTCNDIIYRETTGEDGIAHFSIPIHEDDDEQSSMIPYKEMSIFNGDAEEYSSAENYFGVWIIHRNVFANIETVSKNSFKLTINKLSKDKNAKVDYNLSEIYDGLYDTDVEINLIETANERYISDYKYNEYTKENEPEYSYTDSQDTRKIKTISTKNGVLEFNANDLEYKKDTEDISYSYDLEFIFKDPDGKRVRETQYIEFGEDYREKRYGYFYDGVGEMIYNDNNIYDISPNLDEFSYYTYRYYFKNDTSKFSVGDTVNLTLAESTEKGSKDIKNEGKLLTIVLQENITKTEITENDKITYTFTDKDIPGCKITAAYFYNGRIYRMPIYYFDFNEENKKLDVEIISDKEEYKPGDKVTLTVKTTNNGKPIKSSVNISVVNEAIFEIQEDSTDILETIYDNKSYPVYTYSSNMDYLRHTDGGGGGGDGEPRGDFGDTAHFETVNTDGKGTATVTFKLPDNVTKYRVTAHAANKDLYLGVNTKNIVSKLDFFVQSVEPRNIKTTDDLVLNATSVAEEKYNVEYEFTIKELNKKMTVKADTNNIATANFGKLPYGTYHVIIKGKAQNQEDAIEYKFNVVESTQEVKTKTTVNVNENTKITPNKNPIVLEIYNKNMSNYLKYVDFIESTATQRLDTQIAYNEVQKIKNEYYKTENTIAYLNTLEYEGTQYFKNLPNGKEDKLLTALISYYAEDYYKQTNMYTSSPELSKDDNIYEVYLLAAANQEPVLSDLLYLKEEKDTDNYNKLLVTLSLEFLGDFQNAKQMYNNISLTDAEKEEYKSLIAIIETFIKKDSAVDKINTLIEKSPSDEYLRFAILSFFENNSAEIKEEDTIKIVSKNLNETMTLNGMEVKTYTIYNEDLDTISFETSSNDIMVSYYYQTLLDNIDSKDMSKDIKVKIDGDLKKNNTVKLIMKFDGEFEGDVRIALPNSLRLAYNYDYDDVDELKKGYYIKNNQIDYVTLFKEKKCKKIELPLIITYEGEYKFENIVCYNEGKYHISNSLDLNIK